LHLTNAAASLGTNYDGVDLLTAAKWLSDWPPPKAFAAAIAAMAQSNIYVTILK